MTPNGGPIGASTMERIMAFEDRFARAQASDIVELPFGFVLLHTDFPLSHYHNRVAVTSDAPASDMIATAERVLGGAGLGHRYVSVSFEPTDDLIGEFLSAGYDHEAIATMVYAGQPFDPPDHPVSVVSLDNVRPAILRDWKASIPEAAEEELLQLVDRTALYDLGAELVRLAVYSGEEIAAHADLYLDRVDRIAQFENLVTHDDFRGRGYAGALLREAWRRSEQVESDIFFLSADVEDWPYRWYQRVGFVDVETSHHFSRRL